MSIRITTESLMTAYAREFDTFHEVIDHLGRIGYLHKRFHEAPQGEPNLVFPATAKAAFEDRWIHLEEGERRHSVEWTGTGGKIVWKSVVEYLKDAYDARH